MILSLSFFVVSLAGEPAAYSQIKQKLLNVKSFEVSFSQRVKQDLFVDQGDQAKGSLKFSKPNQMHWTYTQPRPRQITFDGQKLIIEEGGERQEIRDLGRVTLEKSFAFLWGQIDPLYFSLENRSASSFRIHPKKRAEVNFDWMEVSVSKGLVQSVIVKDKLGGESHMSFSGWKFN